jgi:hypothetical protein
MIEKNSRGEEFIQFNYKAITMVWKPALSLLDIYDQFKKIINTPPIFIGIGGQGGGDKMNNLGAYKANNVHKNNINNHSQNHNQIPANNKNNSSP